MASIDGLLAILEDRGLMPAVALFSLTAVLGLLYLSSGNGTPRRGTRLDIERCAACGYTLLVETRDDGTALEWELDETDYRNDNRKGKR